MQFDETDKRILLELTRNSRVGNKRLADKLGLAYNTVVSRIRKMEADGVISGYTACVDFAKLGFTKTLLTTYAIDWAAYNDSGDKISRKHSKSKPEVLFHAHSPVGNYHGLMISLHPADFNPSKALESAVTMGSFTRNHYITEVETSRLLKFFSQESLTALLESLDVGKVPKAEKKDV